MTDELEDFHKSANKTGLDNNSLSFLFKLFMFTKKHKRNIIYLWDDELMNMLGVKTMKETLLLRENLVTTGHLTYSQKSHKLPTGYSISVNNF